MTDPTSAAILTHCLGGPAVLKPILATQPRATVYRRVSELVEQGLLAKEGERYVTTPAGEAMVSAKTPVVTTDEPGPTLDAIPHLAHLPSATHQAAALLVLGAVTARKYLGMADSLAGFAFLGPPMKWKTKCAEMLLAAVGAPAECLIYCPTEAGRSLFVRRTGQGDIQSIRKILESPLVAFDEYGRASAGVQAVIGAYLHGQREIPFENEKVELKPTPIILSNPAKTTGTILDRLGVDEAQMRRLIVFDFESVVIPEEIEDKGQERLKAVREMPPLELKAPTGLSPASRELIKAAIKAIIPLKTNLRFVDFSLVASTIEGLTGYLPEEEAVRAGLLAYGRSLSTIGFATPGWPTIIQEILAPQEDEPRPESVGVPVGGNPFDYTTNLRRLHGEIRATGYSEKELGSIIGNFKLIVGFLRGIDLDPAKVFQMLRGLRSAPEALEWVRDLLTRLEGGSILMIMTEHEGNTTSIRAGEITQQHDPSQTWIPGELTCVSQRRTPS